MAFIYPKHSIEPQVFLGKTFIDPNLKHEPTFDIASLFANGEQGFWLDPSDLSTMFKDAAGTVPVTGVGQTVGLILDKSGAGKNAYQVDTAKQPILRFNALINRYYLEFDGVDDHLLIDGLTAFSIGSVVGAVEARSSVSRTRAIFSAGIGGYIYISGSGLNTQVAGDSAFIAYPQSSRYFAVDYNGLDVTLVNLKQSVIRQVTTFPFNNTNQRTLGKFLPTSATSGDLNYYGLVCIDRILSEEERHHIFKKYGAVL